jgi:hypothetical protein
VLLADWLPAEEMIVQPLMVSFEFRLSYTILPKVRIRGETE